MHVEIHFTPDPIVVPLEVLPSREIGASVEFRGIVREMEQGSALQGLYYEAYEPMARTVLQRHFTELAALHPCAAVIFIHRTGWVPVGEASLFMRVLSAHRGEALAFLSAAINRLKQDVPVWKLVQVPD